MAGLTGLGLDPLGLQPPAAVPPDQVEDLVDGDPPAAADVDGLGEDRGLHGQQIRPDRVIDVGEVAGLLAVAVDDHRPAA